MLPILILVPALAAAQEAPKPPLELPRGPTVGIIDFYGVHKVGEEKLRKALGFSVGELLPRSKGDVEERVEGVPGVVRARIEATCCDGSKAVLYVGIEEKGAPTFTYRAAPSEQIELPDEILAAYKLFLGELANAVASGQTAENLRQGYSLMEHAGARAAQQRFLELAKEHQKLLSSVLRNSSMDEHRAVAAYLIGYAPDRKAVVNDLQYALQDPDDGVRNHAVRALTAIAVPAMKEPESGIRVSPTWFVEMLHSLIWTDRNNAAVALVTLTEQRDARTLDLLRERAMPQLLEMARWKHLPHALPAFILAGRVAGLKEEAIQEAWRSGDREKVLSAGSGSSTRKSAPPDRR